MKAAKKKSVRVTSTTTRPPEPPAAIRRGDRNESLTVLRACDVLKAFRHLGEELPLGEVVTRTNLPKTTVFRLLRTLIHGGLLERASSGVYRNRFGPVTARPFRIGFAAQGDSEFCRAVTQSMEVAAARQPGGAPSASGPGVAQPWNLLGPQRCRESSAGAQIPGGSRAR